MENIIPLITGATIMLALFGLTGSSAPDQPPFIKNITFETMDGKTIGNNAGWFKIGDKVKIVITLEEQCQKIDLFFTGTGMADEQKLIGEAFPAPDTGTTEYTWKYTWTVPDDILGHFSATAYNGNGARQSALYHVISPKKHYTSRREK